MNNYTSLLYARPTFLEGVARLVDFGGFLNDYNYAEDGDAADQIALASDWYAIGDDMRQAFVSYAQQHGIETRHAGTSVTGSD